MNYRELEEKAVDHDHVPDSQRPRRHPLEKGLKVQAWGLGIGSWWLKVGGWGFGVEDLGSEFRTKGFEIEKACIMLQGLEFMLQT